MRIKRADFESPELTQFLAAHLRDIAPTAPPASQHALDVAALRAPGVRLWAGYDDSSSHVIGTVALAKVHGAAVSAGDEELKSMRIDPARRGQGLGAALLDFVLTDARNRSVPQIWLETGSMDYFEPARRLYTQYGFVEVGPFGGYKPDPNSTFMALTL